jgi:beta-galactosidase
VAIVQNGENVATENGRTGALPHIALRGITIPLLCPKIQMGKKYFFEGAMSEPLVYLNGKKVGEWAYGYSYFYFDVSYSRRNNTLPSNYPIKNLLHVGILVPVYIEM